MKLLRETLRKRKIEDVDWLKSARLFCAFSNPRFGTPLHSRRLACKLISQKVFIKLFCKSRFPYKFVSLLFVLVMVKDMLTNLWVGRLLPNDLRKTLCKIE